MSCTVHSVLNKFLRTPFSLITKGSCVCSIISLLNIEGLGCEYEDDECDPPATDDQDIFDFEDEVVDEFGLGSKKDSSSFTSLCDDSVKQDDSSLSNMM